MNPQRNKTASFGSLTNQKSELLFALPQTQNLQLFTTGSFGASIDPAIVLTLCLFER